MAESGLNGFNLKKEKIKEENFWMNDVGVGEKIESGMLTINKFKPYGLTAAMTTKELGNMSYSKGNKKLAEANFARAVGILGIRPSRTPVFVLNATHSNNIVYVKPVESVTGRNVLLRNSEHILRLHTPRGVFIPPSSMPNREKGVDAAITKNPNLYLAICAADCAVVMLFDPKTNVFGISHAGAIGLFSQIIPSTILQMANLFGANPKDILCYIPPCVKKESYRLRESNLWRSILREQVPEDMGLDFDLRELILTQLIEVGINKDNIGVSDLCTYEANLFFSSGRAKTPLAKKQEGRNMVIFGGSNVF